MTVSRTRLAIVSLAAALALGAAQPAPRRARVVLFTVDAGSDAFLDNLLASDALRGGAFDRIAARGLVAESMDPPSIASTPVSHATMYTGAWPDENGITGVGLPSDTIAGDLRPGFGIATDVARVWSLVNRAGKRSVCLIAPGAEATRPDNTCTETIAFGTISRAGSPPASSPGDMLTRLLAKLGPSPGEPDSRPVTRGEVTEEAYVAGAHRFAEYVSSMVLDELHRSDWDFLAVYMPLVDNLEHRYLVTDPRQADYGEERGARRQRFYERIIEGYKTIDRLVAAWLAASPDTNFLIVSDHGMIPIHSTVVLGNVLASAGLKVGGAGAEVRVISSGASAQVYVNSRRRFTSGTIADAEVPAIVRRIVDACRAVRDPQSGEPVFRTIATWDELGPLHLKHPHAGDVFVSAGRGWGVTGRVDPAVPPVVPNTLSPDTRKRVSRSPAEEAFLAAGGLNELSPGVHGVPAADPDIRAFFHAIGPRIPRRRIGRIEMIDVTPTVLDILGVPKPSNLAGRSAIGRTR